MDLTWYGHSTWLVEVGTTSLLIDPFFQNPHTSHTSAEIADPDYLLVTHGHQDHIADAGAFDGATVVATPAAWVRTKPSRSCDGCALWWESLIGY